VITKVEVIKEVIKEVVMDGVLAVVGPENLAQPPSPAMSSSRCACSRCMIGSVEFPALPLCCNAYQMDISPLVLKGHY
jgi:hypothetical protein